MPVSVLLIRAPRAADGGTPTTRLHQMLRRRLRPYDSISAAPGGGLMIVAPQTSAQTAAGLAHDLRAALTEGPRRAAAAVTVAAATCRSPEPAEALIARAEAGTRQPVHA